MARTYAKLNAADLGPSLELEQGALVLTSSAASTSSIARATISKANGTVGLWGIESAVWLNLDLSPAPTIATTDWAVGFATAAQSLSVYLGFSLESVGWRPLAGEVWHNGAVVAGLTGIPLATVKQHVFMTLDQVTRECKLYIDKSLVKAFTLPLTGTLFPALQVQNAVAYGTKALARFQFPFESKPDTVVTDGWFTEAVALTSLRTAAGGSYMSGTADTTANTLWRESVVPSQSWITRAVSFWPWGESGASSYGDITLDNTPANADGSGRFDSLLNLGIAGEVVELAAIVRRDNFSSRVVFATAIADKVAAADRDRLSVNLLGTLSLLDKPLQNRIMPPWTPNGFAPQPIVIGAARNIEPVPLDLIGKAFQIHDRNVANLAKVYDKSDALEPATAWTFNADAKGFTLTATPAGKVTADVSAAGLPIVVVPASDPLVGEGEFTTESATVGIATGWQVNGTTITANGTAFWGADEGGIQILQATSTTMGAATRAVLELVTARLLPNKTYRVTVDMIRAYRWSGAPNQGERWFIGNNADPAVGQQLTGSGPGQFSRIITTGGVAEKLYFGVYSLMQATVGWIRVVEQVGYSAPALEGATLSDAVGEIMSRGDIDPADWSRADTDAIYAALPYQVGWARGAEPVTVLDALRSVLRPYNAEPYEDRQGIIRFAKLIDPALALDSTIKLYITKTMLLAEPVPVQDLAPNLTTGLFARPNWTDLSDSDFVADYVELPAATRVAFKAPGQLRSAIDTPLDPAYEHARNAKPFLSLFDTLAGARAALQVALNPYYKQRSFMVLEVAGQHPTINPGDIVHFTFPRWGLSAGAKMLVYMVSVDLSGKGFRLGVWY